MDKKFSVNTGIKLCACIIWSIGMFPQTTHPPKIKHTQVIHLSKDPDPTKHSSTWWQFASVMTAKNSILAETELCIHTDFTDASVTTSVYTWSCNTGISKLILQLTHTLACLQVNILTKMYKMSCYLFLTSNNHWSAAAAGDTKCSFRQECLRSIKINETVDFFLIITSFWLSEKMYLFHVKPLITPSFQ